MPVEQTARLNKILVVDDDISMVQVCQLILQSDGYEVREAVNGRQALRLIADEMPDFILLDIMMPGISGIEVCRLIRQEHSSPQPMIVMYSADGRAEVRAECMAAGADGFVIKQNPFHDLPGKIIPFLTAQPAPVI